MVRGHKAWWLELFRALLVASGVPDRDEVAEELMLLLDGTFARVLVTREVEPAKPARRLAAMAIRARLSGAG